jgi:hypothetical protein
MGLWGLRVDAQRQMLEDDPDLIRVLGTDLLERTCWSVGQTRLQKGHWKSLNSTISTLASFEPRAGDPFTSIVYSWPGSGRRGRAGAGRLGAAAASKDPSRSARAVRTPASSSMPPSTEDDTM